MIEALVQAGRKDEAHAAIRKHLRATPEGSRDDSRLLECCDWLRRLGLFAEGLRLLDLESALRSGSAQRSKKWGRRLFWAARFLNLMGAAGYARILVARF